MLLLLYFASRFPQIHMTSTRKKATSFKNLVQYLYAVSCRVVYVFALLFFVDVAGFLIFFFFLLLFDCSFHFLATAVALFDFN